MLIANSLDGLCAEIVSKVKHSPDSPLNDCGVVRSMILEYTSDRDKTIVALRAEVKQKEEWAAEWRRVAEALKGSQPGFLNLVRQNEEMKVKLELAERQWEKLCGMLRKTNDAADHFRDCRDCADNLPCVEGSKFASILRGEVFDTIRALEQTSA